MTGCYWYGIDCSDCDDSEGIPECFESRFAHCSEHGQYDRDVGCLQCELEAETRSEEDA